jgi:dTDP-4-dehydrorhamnose 3,5-epimerase-like enzyme
MDGIALARPWFYEMSEVFHPQCAAGVRWNDLAFGID